MSLRLGGRYLLARRVPESSRLGLPPLRDRIFFVTGATAGIGEFTAELLAKEGCTVLVHGRDPAKVEGLVAELKRLSGNEKLHGFVADLSLQAEVRRLAADVSARFPVLHGLLNSHVLQRILFFLDPYFAF